MLTTWAHQSASRALRLALVSLSAAIFAWGLQSRLALYRPASPSRTIAIVRVAEVKQRSLLAPGTVSPFAGRLHSARLGHWLTRLCCSSLVPQTLPFQRTSQPSRLSVHLSFVPSCFRPPPFVL